MFKLWRGLNVFLLYGKEKNKVIASILDPLISKARNKTCRKTILNALR